MSSLLDAALDWAEQGIPVFPCGSNKAPMTANGHLDASTDPSVVKDMFAGLRDGAFIGGAMGVKSGLFACDFDTYKPGAAGLSASEYMATLEAAGILPPTQTHATLSGGLHMIYASDTDFPNCKPVAGVEIKGEGGYIILPPSPGYSITDGSGFASAPKSLIARLMQGRREHTAKTIRTHEDAIISGDSFHDAITSIAAKMFRRGSTPAEVSARIFAALGASVASSPAHPRHERWASLMQDTSGEVARVVISGRDKYDSAHKTAEARDNVDADMAERLKAVADALGLRSGPPDGSSPSEGKKAEPEDYAGEWPFEGAGYFANEDLDIASQKFTIHPIYCENESVIIVADPKAGKTAISLKLAFTLALGQSLGPFKVAEPRAVLYYSLEGTRAVKLRVEAEKRYRIKNGETLPDSIPFFVVEKSANFITKQDDEVAKIVAADRWFKKKTGQGLGIVCIDTLTKAMPGADQNSVDDTSRLFEMNGKLRDYGVTATIVFIHHVGKDGRTRGSSNIEAEVDVVLKVTKQEDGSSVMRVHMARSIDDATSYKFRLKSFDLGETEQGIRQAAPVVVLDETGTTDGTTNTMRSAKIAPWLSMIVGAETETLDMDALVRLAHAAKLVTKRTASVEVRNILLLIFDREPVVAYRNCFVTLVKTGGTPTGVTVRLA